MFHSECPLARGNGEPQFSFEIIIIFSNILKYGDKKGEVDVRICPECGRIKIRITNLIKKDAADTESNQIGLRSVRKMVEMHQGELYTFVDTNIYTVGIVFDLIHKCSG